MTDKNTEPRKRGAPRGNSNAVKYGFYSKKTMRHLNFNPAKDGPEVLMQEFDLLRDAFHTMFAKVTPQSSLTDMLAVCKLLFYTTTAFNHLISAVYHPSRFKDTNVYDWDTILERINNLPLNRPDPFFPASPFDPSHKPSGVDE